MVDLHFYPQIKRFVGHQAEICVCYRSNIHSQVLTSKMRAVSAMYTM